MTGATTWHGRRGSVLLGPTEDRVARWLRDMTRTGRVTIRTVDLAAACRVERSEAYRITRRLRILGLFGIENDQGGSKGGRRYWRTAIEHDGAELDADRHRTAWARLTAWSQARRDRMRDALGKIRVRSRRPFDQLHADQADRLARLGPPGAGEPTFSERMRAAGLGSLMDGWGVT